MRKAASPVHPGRLVAMGSGDVCPASGRLLAFARSDGSVARMAVVRPSCGASRTIGRYVVGPKIATGGMATVHLGRLRGSGGFARTVAVKRLLPELARDPEFVTRFVDEARIASRINHANVVPTLDVVNHPEVLLVLEYVHGESLARLLRAAVVRGERCPPAVASAIVTGVLRGLHVAHHAKDANGVPLDLVHRDVSPQNVLVGADGVPRVLDFGIAKASGREHSTFSKGSAKGLRGKLAYMAPEQVAGEPMDRRADLFAAGVILWEALAGDRLFKCDEPMKTMQAIFHHEAAPLAATIPGMSPRVDEVLATALAKDPGARYATADEMARAIEIALPPGSDREVADWVEKVGAELIAERAAVLALFEGSSEDDEESSGEREVADPTTQKRSAVFPPPLLGAEPPKLADSARTLPVATTTPPEPLRTPLAMVTPAIDPLASSGMTQTRVGPVVTPPPRTPIPMPMAVRPARFSAAKIAALVLAPPVLAALAIFVFHPSGSRSAPASASGPPDAPPAAVAAEPPPPALTVPVPPEPAPPPTPPKIAEPASHPTSAASTAPNHRGPRPRNVGPRVPRRR